MKASGLTPAQKRALALVAILALAGCRDDALEATDGKVLCDPETGHAYYMQPGAWDVTFVVRTQSADALCRIPKDHPRP